MLATACSAAVPNGVKPEPNQRFSDVVRGADYVLVRTGGNCHRDLKHEKVVFEASGDAAVVRIARLFGFTGEYTSVFRTTFEGEDVLAISNCLCCGTHTFSFQKRGVEVLSISVHHWSHARPTGEWKSNDINLSKDSVERLKSFLLQSAPQENKG
jgi:hypothetical protein